MSDGAHPVAISSSDDSLKTFAMVGYILMVASVLTGGLAAVAALVLAYVKRGDAGNSWVASHFTWQIRSLWWCLAWSVLGGVTLAFGVGWLILVGVCVWYVYRIVRGLVRLTDRRAAY